MAKHTQWNKHAAKTTTWPKPKDLNLGESCLYELLEQEFFFLFCKACNVCLISFPQNPVRNPMMHCLTHLNYGGHKGKYVLPFFFYSFTENVFTYIICG